jgi:sigma-B regulation protein RsbU (phosphoserine phosphatase)
MSAAPVPKAGASEPPRILIVDDTEAMRMLYAASLRTAGFEVEVAVDGFNALDVLAVRMPDLVLLDFMMPGMSGVDVLGKLRADARTATLPVVLLTADDLPESIEAGFAAGADDYMTKPVDRRILASRLRSVIAARRDRDRVSLAKVEVAELDGMREALKEARELQRAQVAPMPQRLGQWNVEGALVPCGEVGGDLFDALPGERPTLAFVDVSGHGLSSAMVASSIRSFLRLVLRTSTATEAMAHLNEHLVEMGGDHYACVALIQIDGDGFTVVNAGLPPIAVVDVREGRVLETIAAGGVPPGLMSDQTYDAIHLTAKPGTRIVVQSDGLTESFGDADDVLPSLERLGLLNGAVTSPVLEQRVQALFTTDQPDDATLLVLDFQP